MTELIRRNGFGLGYALMLTGLAVLLGGFALDSYLHADDPTLASREGIFTLSNPGHLMVAVGLCMTVVGACLGPYSRWVLPRRSPFVAFVVPAALFAVLLSASFAWANVLSSLSHDSHTHTDTAASADHTTAGGAASAHHSAFILEDNQATVALSESTMHEPANTQQVTATNLEFADQFLADIRTNLDKYKDVNVAVANGYFQITPDIPLIGAHFYHAAYDGLDPARPTNLLYHKDASGGWTLAGVAFQLPKTDDTPPDSPLGGLAGWHYHTDLCFLSGGNVTIATDSAHCAGLFVKQTGWLLHVWAWLDSPEGVFSHANSLLQ